MSIGKHVKPRPPGSLRDKIMVDPNNDRRCHGSGSVADSPKRNDHRCGFDYLFDLFIARRCDEGREFRECQGMRECTRVTKSERNFLDPLAPSLTAHVGENDGDRYRRDKRVRQESSLTGRWSSLIRSRRPLPRYLDVPATS